MIEISEAGTYGWGGISVELGNKRRSVESIEDGREKFKAWKLPMNSELLGYESFYESTLMPQEPISRAIASSLAAVDIDAHNIDMLILASADVEFLADRQILPELLQRNSLLAALPLTITSQECTSLLSAINVACMYVKGGAGSNILVVSYDKAKDDTQRIQSFGVVSDAVVACVVSSGDRSDFRVKGFSHKSDLPGMRGGDDFGSRKALTNLVVGDVLAQGEVSLSDVSKVFATNFFSPVAKYNASGMGLAEHQFCMDLAPKFGHCLCADPLINLQASLCSEPTRCRGDLYLLQAYAPGFLASMLIECATDSVSGCYPGESSEVVVQSW